LSIITIDFSGGVVPTPKRKKSPPQPKPRRGSCMLWLSDLHFKDVTAFVAHELDLFLSAEAGCSSFFSFLLYTALPVCAFLIETAIEDVSFNSELSISLSNCVMDKAFAGTAEQIIKSGNINIFKSLFILSP